MRDFHGGDGQHVRGESWRLDFTKSLKDAPGPGSSWRGSAASPRDKRTRDAGLWCPDIGARLNVTFALSPRRLTDVRHPRITSTTGCGHACASMSNEFKGRTALGAAAAPSAMACTSAPAAMHLSSIMARLSVHQGTKCVHKCPPTKEPSLCGYSVGQSLDRGPTEATFFYLSSKVQF